MKGCGILVAYQSVPVFISMGRLPLACPQVRAGPGDQIHLRLRVIGAGTNCDAVTSLDGQGRQNRCRCIIRKLMPSQGTTCQVVATRDVTTSAQGMDDGKNSRLAKDTYGTRSVVSCPSWGVKRNTLMTWGGNPPVSNSCASTATPLLSASRR